MLGEQNCRSSCCCILTKRVFMANTCKMLSSTDSREDSISHFSSEEHYMFFAETQLPSSNIIMSQ